MLIFIVLILLVCMVFTFRKPKIWKYNALIGSELFVTFCWSIRYAFIQQMITGKFRPADALYIELGLPIVILILTITLVVCLSTRHRWCIKDDTEFCS